MFRRPKPRVYAGMGDRDNAFRWLEKACHERDLWLVFLNVDPRWRKLSRRSPI